MPSAPALLQHPPRLRSSKSATLVHLDAARPVPIAGMRSCNIPCTCNLATASLLPNWRELGWGQAVLCSIPAATPETTALQGHSQQVGGSTPDVSGGSRSCSVPGNCNLARAQL